MTAFLTISRLLILVLLSVGADTDEKWDVTGKCQESDLDCISSLMVPRNTAWSVRVTDILKINCTVNSDSHCWKHIVLSWCKTEVNNVCRPLKHSDHVITRWWNISESRRMSLLIFRKISMQDAGLYRCEIKSPTPTVSHTINVTVTDIHTDYNVSTEIAAGAPAVTVPVTDEAQLSGEKWLYMICVSVLVVALVLTVPLIMSRGFKKFPKDEVTMTTVIYKEVENSSVQD